MHSCSHISRRGQFNLSFFVFFRSIAELSMHQVLILTAYQCSTIKYLSSHDAHTRQAQTHTRMHTRTLVYTQLNLPCCQSLLHMQRKMFNYNAENNNNYNSDNNNSRAKAEWGPEWVAVDKRYDEVGGSGAGGNAPGCCCWCPCKPQPPTHQQMAAAHWHFRWLLYGHTHTHTHVHAHTHTHAQALHT